MGLERNKMKYLLAAVATMWTFPVEAGKQQLTEFMPFDFTAQCLPLKDMASHLSTVHGELPVFTSNQSLASIGDNPMKGNMVLSINPVSGSWTHIFVGQGNIACILSNGTNLQLNGDMFQTK